MRIQLPSEESKQDVVNCRIDVVDAGKDWVKALLKPDELIMLEGRGYSIEILHEEMARDRALWSEAAATAGLADSYYTPSKFNTTDPPAGSLMEHLLAQYNAHPTLCRLYNLGASQDGAYDIVALKLSKNPDAVEAEPKIRIYANIHGDERAGLMIACDVLDWILANYPADARAKKLVDEAETWFIPMGNPYGNANNTRYNSRSVDLNRNFWGPIGSDEPPAWSEAETRAIRDLTEALPHRKRFANSLSFHGGATCFNSVYNYTSAPTTDEPIFFSSRTGGPSGEANPAPGGLAKAYQDGCTASGFWYTNGYDWYQTLGDTNDWAYYQWTDLDTTLEATSTKTPAVSQIPLFCADHRFATINYMLKTFQGIHGVMSDASTGAKIDGTVTVTCTASDTIPVPHAYKEVYSDPVAGDYHRVLQPGTYTVQCNAPGRDPITISGVVVQLDTSTVVNCTWGSPGLHYTGNTFADSCAGAGSGGDGVIDAGEDVTLQVSISNSGAAAATGISTTLSSATPGISIVRNTAALADIPAGSQGSTTAPHFLFSVGSGVACGTIITFNLHTTSAQGAWDDTFTLRVGSSSVGGTVTLLDEPFAGASLPAGWSTERIMGGLWSVSGVSACSAPNALRCSSSSHATNSWVFTSALSLTSGLVYDLSFTQKVADASKPESLAVRVGTSQGQAGMSATVWSNSSLVNTDCLTRTASFSVTTSGTYYLGFDCTSPAASAGLILDDVHVSYTESSCAMHPCTVSAPVETAPGGSPATAQGWTGKDSLTWPSNPQATSYKLYRGTLSGLPALAGPGTDSCLKYEGTSTSAPDADDPGSQAGRFFWYLVTGVNSAGEGSAGPATSGPRAVNSGGGCP